jgi:hypothetical protein
LSSLVILYLLSPTAPLFLKLCNFHTMADLTLQDVSSDNLSSSHHPDSNNTPPGRPAKIQKILVITPIITNFEEQSEDHSTPNNNSLGTLPIKARPMITQIHQQDSHLLTRLSFKIPPKDHQKQRSLSVIIKSLMCKKVLISARTTSKVKSSLKNIFLHLSCTVHWLGFGATHKGLKLQILKENCTRSQWIRNKM